MAKKNSEDVLVADIESVALEPASKLPPNEWAKVRFPASETKRQHADLWQHGAAQALHGWKLHEHHTGSPILLTLEAYESALAAAQKLIGGTYVPHSAALSPHLGKKG